MNFIYHGVPEQMIGTHLIPLNRMDATMAETRDKNLEKYEGREEILERKIPLLDCLWNDVIQFLPLHPQKVFELQQELGLIDNVSPYKFFEINLRNLDPHQTVVFFKTAPGEENTYIKWLKDVDFESLQIIPDATLAYYKSLIGTGELPFNYQFIPHIIYKGTLDISGSNVITLRDT
ncbi:MAG TPA: hypothetical protein VM124_02005 [Candidatus Limnocylindrales bacterium]|nr:hypothetical protein [Candidatus Limnocylindrales bacterium]